MKANRQYVKLCLLGLLVCVGLLGCSRGGVEAAREDRTPAASAADQEFLVNTVQAHLSEIDMARLALGKSDNPDVSEFARTIQKDHSSELQDLAALMASRSVPQPNELPAAAKQEIARMNLLTGPEFDREFINAMVTDHLKAIEMFREQLIQTEDHDIKKYVERLLPRLGMHRDRAQELQSKLFSAPAH